jgi:hypothetical protein
MPPSKQKPLTAARGRSEHDFRLKQDEWEAAVFDNAASFAVIELRQGRRPVTLVTTPKLSDAIEQAQLHSACLYAIGRSGRWVMLDREKWDEWEQRHRTVVVS